MKTAKLSQLFSEAQLTKIDKILGGPKVDRFAKLREYLITQREMLEAQGVMPEYLAYAIEAQQKVS